MNIFSEFFYAIFGVKKYPKFLQNSGGKVFLYIMFAVLVYTVIANAMVIPSSKEVIEEFKEIVRDEIPDFKLKDGELSIEESFYAEEDGVLLSADSEYGSYINQYDKSEWVQMLAEYDSVFMFDATTLLVKDKSQVEIMNYPADFNLDKDDVFDLIDYAYWFIGIYLILAYICNIFIFLFATLIVALLGMIVDSFVGYGLTFGQVFKLSVYAKTCMLVVKALLKLVGFGFVGFFVIMLTVSCLYLGAALSHMKRLDEMEKRYGEPIIF